jgi:hypothetical protein
MSPLPITPSTGSANHIARIDDTIIIVYITPRKMSKGVFKIIDT